MDPAHKTLELVPLDEPDSDTPSEIEIFAMGKAVRDNAVSAGVAGISDRFLKEAMQQYEEGHIDHPLWDRALVQAGNDKTAATEAYLRARATALRLLDRDRRARRPSATTAPDTVTPGVRPPDATERVRFSATISRHRNVMIAAAALVPLGFCGWLLFGYLGGGSTNGAAIARSPTASVQPVARSQALQAAATKAVRDGGSRPHPTPEFLNKIEQLNDAGNWNVLVLYAVEWTRLEPANPAAWNQLRAGYVNLGQYRDAFDAATKAVELAPEDSRMWRNLGQVNMDLNAPTEALRAFDQALAVSPDDATARCLRTAVVPLVAPQKDAKAAAKPSASFDSMCRGLIEPVAAR